MSDTGVLLSKISAFRQRLEQMTTLAGAESGGKPSPPAEAGTGAPLEAKVEAVSRHQAVLERTLRQLTGAAENNGPLPAQLTARARRLVVEGRELVGEMRALGDDPLLAGPPIPAEGTRLADDSDPLLLHYRETVAILEASLRLLQVFPDVPSVQLRLCEGLEGILNAIRSRLAALRSLLARRGREADRVNTLARILCALDAGEAVDFATLTQLADGIIADAQTEPLRFLHAHPQASQAYHGGPAFAPPARFVACHSLTVAQVLARLTRHDPEWRSHPVEPVLAALLHDVGMLRVPLEVLSVPGPLSDPQRRAVEAHARAGAEVILQALPALSGLAEVIATHHERLDGTGYPAGLKEAPIGPLARFLAVADTYAALCCPRPHRAALDPRTALTDTLLLAERGQLDRYCAEKLLHLSFYPVGSVVELADGSVGVVVANHMAQRDLSTPSRPVLALVADPEGKLLPMPRHLDLAECDGGTIVRALPAEQRRQLLGSRYPEWA